MSSDAVEKKDTKALQDLLRAFKGQMPEIRLGILGGGGVRSDGNGVTNAAVGAAHEYGTESLPMRSFLRMPVQKHLNAYLTKSKAFNEMTLKEVIRSKNIKPWMQKIAITAEQVVAEAFDTGGFGEWQPSDMTHKQNAQTLVETQQLRNSVTSEVK